MTTKQATKKQQQPATKHNAHVTSATTITFNAAAVLREIGIENAKRARSLLRAHAIRNDARTRQSMLEFFAARGNDKAKALLASEAKRAKRVKR